ncbi:MAG: hypothetical protein ABIO70_12325 [Pseudomonadota bacterium]
MAGVILPATQGVVPHRASPYPTMGVRRAGEASRIRACLEVSDCYTLKAPYPEAARAEVAELRPGSRVSFAARVASVDTGYVVVEPVVAGA